MAEYIDREKFRKHIHDVTNDQNCPLYIAVTIEQYIDEEPAADVAPIVRCKDCVYSGVYGESILFCENFERDMMPDDFCSLGARMDGTEG